MTNYEKLVEALRCKRDDCEGCDIAFFDKDEGWMCQYAAKDDDAAAAIEALQTEVEKQRDTLMMFGGETGIRQMRDELGHWQDEVVRLRAEVKRLKECNDELREAQTYIDHYGDKWMTSAKDVPTSAYNHGYMDGKNEAEQALEPKRGEWLNVTDSYHWYGKCSVCGEEFVVDAYYAGGMNYCPNCGAKMTEVQDDKA